VQSRLHVLRDVDVRDIGRGGRGGRFEEEVENADSWGVAYVGSITKK
jgi:hypothetical protein